MSTISLLEGKVELHCGDCIAAMALLPDCSVDSVVTDPPYGISFMGRSWDAADSLPFSADFWKECLRILKPGGHLLSFSGARTYHRMTCAIEDAGFEIRDQIMWVFGSGFPKSLDVSKAIDKAAFAVASGDRRVAYANVDIPITSPATDAARQWEGWGTALKPAHEPICVARKPLIGTVAANVLKFGTGAINIDGCRVGDEERHNNPASPTSASRKSRVAAGYRHDDGVGPGSSGGTVIGRFPANLIHDGSDEVLATFPDAPGQQQAVGPEHGKKSSVNCYGDYGARNQFNPRGDSGSAARFYYTAKADADDRIASKHPTVKPLDLMQYLVRLVTPKGGLVLDPFAGSGTTGEAAWREGMRAILIEREPEHQEDIVRRMDLADKPTKRAAVVAAKGKTESVDSLPLFGAGEAAQ